MNSEGSTLSAFDIIAEENCPTAPPGKQGSDAPTGKTPNAGTRREKQPALKVSKVKKASKSAESITSNTTINEESSKTSKGFDELSHKIDQLTAVVGNCAPVIAELKATYDAGLNEDSPDDSEDDNGVLGEPPAKKRQSEHVLTKRKEDMKRPENCKLLRVTKVNTEIWDIAQKTTRSMDARIQKLQETLIKGLTPLAYLTGKVGREQPVLTIPRFTSDEKLCVASTLEEYLSRTQDLRDGENQLFISVIRPYKKVSKETISRCIKEVMALSGIDTTMFTPHSTRAASTSKVFNKVPLQTIMKSASWRSDCVFNKFYNKAITRSSDNSF
ncbi:hypothetical protein AWC38_SpisGene20562 [Stylophora pistillata]|uniref:Uncharacterized protein n=1 Tax=Stylophora pistillata TaxID=50429 RepID=A0A2B4RDJ6_STYPI|nr:hypothetical protein AWC38_SpisGene20562 [Stylophora pistillata]